MSNSHLTFDEQLDLDLQDSGGSCNVLLNRDIGLRLYKEFRQTLRTVRNYRSARDQALDLALLNQTIRSEEREGYKDFLDRRMQRAAAEARKRKREQKREMNSIPFAPIGAYKDDMR